MNKHRLISRARVIHCGHEIAHCTYLFLVSVYAHAPYAYAAGGLLIFVVVAHFTKAEIPED